MKNPEEIVLRFTAEGEYVDEEGRAWHRGGSLANARGPLCRCGENSGTEARDVWCPYHRRYTLVVPVPEGRYKG